MQTIYVVNTSYFKHGEVDNYHYVGDDAVRAAACGFFTAYFLDRLAGMAEETCGAGAFADEFATLTNYETITEAGKTFNDVDTYPFSSNWFEFHGVSAEFEEKYDEYEVFRANLVQKVFAAAPIPKIMELMVEWGDNNVSGQWGWGWRSVTAIDERRNVVTW